MGDKLQSQLFAQAKCTCGIWKQLHQCQNLDKVFLAEYPYLHGTASTYPHGLSSRDVWCPLALLSGPVDLEYASLQKNQRITSVAGSSYSELALGSRPTGNSLPHRFRARCASNHKQILMGTELFALVRYQLQSPVRCCWQLLVWVTKVALERTHFFPRVMGRHTSMLAALSCRYACAQEGNQSSRSAAVNLVICCEK